VRAAGHGVPEERVPLVVEVALVERITAPTTSPMFWEVLLSPEARRASCGCVAAGAEIASGTDASGTPKPITTKPGKTFVQDDRPPRPA